MTKVAPNRIYRVFLDGRYERFGGTGKVGLEDGSLAEASLARPNGIAVSPDRGTLFVNNLDGPWRGDEETLIVIRKIRLDP